MPTAEEKDPVILSGVARSMEGARALQKPINHYPLKITPSFTFGGKDDAMIANSGEELEQYAERGLDMSPTGEVLIEYIFEEEKIHEHRACEP